MVGFYEHLVGPIKPYTEKVISRPCAYNLKNCKQSLSKLRDIKVSDKEYFISLTLNHVMLCHNFRQ